MTLAMAFVALAASCSPGGDAATAPPFSASEPTDAQQVPLAGTSIAGPAPACSPTTGEGTVAPTITIHSIALLVDGTELILSEGDVLRAPPGSEVRVVEVKICVGAFAGNGGQACVDLAPTRESGEEIAAEHAGTHLVPLAPGLITVRGPDRSWTIDQSWVAMAVVVNHWPGVNTDDHECAEGQCERDHRLVFPFQ